MLTEKDKLTVMQSNLAAIEMLAQKVIEQVRHAAEPAPEDYDDSRRYTHLVGGLGNLSDLTTVWLRQPTPSTNSNNCQSFPGLRPRNLPGE